MVTEVTKQSGKLKSRSSAYPGFNIESSIDAVRTLRIKLGDGPYSRDQAAIQLGYSGISGTSSTRIAACSHFGLLDKNGNAYMLSDLAKKIIVNMTEEEKRLAIIEAVKTPVLYSKLITAYDGQALPLSLDNILDRNYGITSTKTKHVVSIFKQSIEFAGIFRNGIVLSSGFSIEKDNDIAPNSNLTKPLSSEERQECFDSQTLRKDGFMDLMIPNTEIVLTFPKKYAYSLAMGDFRESIEGLQKDAENIDKKLNDINHTKE